MGIKKLTYSTFFNEEKARKTFKFFLFLWNLKIISKSIYYLVDKLDTFARHKLTPKEKLILRMSTKK